MRSPEDFQNYVATELRKNDSQMGDLTRGVSDLKESHEHTRSALELSAASIQALHESVSSLARDSAEMLEVFKSWKGAMKVIDWVGALAKPLGAIILLGVALVGLWKAIRPGG